MNKRLIKLTFLVLVALTGITLWAAVDQIQAACCPGEPGCSGTCRGYRVNPPGGCGCYTNAEGCSGSCGGGGGGCTVYRYYCHANTPRGNGRTTLVFCTPGSCTCDPGPTSYSNTVFSCGDGVRQYQCNEQCDDGNAVQGDGCFGCRNEFCGDSIINDGPPGGPGEECDDGPGNSNSPNANCRATGSTACKLRRCGDGIIDDAFGEQCDDGNTNEFDSCNSSCQFTATADPWLATSEGNIYATQGYAGFIIENAATLSPPITAAAYGYDYNKVVNLAEFLVGSGDASLPGTSFISENNFRALNYTDNSLTAYRSYGGQTNWYDFLRQIVVRNRGSNPSVINTASITSANINTALGATANALYVGERTGDLTIGQEASSGSVVCNIKGVIFVTGNLTIVPDVRTSAFTNGCIYIVKGNITVGLGQRKNPGSALPSDPSQYDILEGMFITNGSFTVPIDQFGANDKWDGLFVKGTVISKTVSLNRDLRAYSNVTQPAEIYVYDPRYSAIPELRIVIDFKKFSLKEF